MCLSLDQPESVDSVLTFLSGYDTLKYSWVKATTVSVRLRILFVTLQSINNGMDQGGAQGEEAQEQAPQAENDDDSGPIQPQC